MSLQLFLWFFIGCMALSVGCRFLLLSYKDYPRSMEWTRGGDCFTIIVHAAFAVWAFMLLP